MGNEILVPDKQWNVQVCKRLDNRISFGPDWRAKIFAKLFLLRARGITVRPFAQENVLPIVKYLISNGDVYREQTCSLCKRLLIFNLKFFC